MNPISRVTRQLAYSRALSTATAAPSPAAAAAPLSAFDSALSASSSAPLPTETSSILPTRIPPPPSLTPSTETALLQTLARLIMKSGKLPRAHTHLATCLSSLSRSTSSPPVPILQRALEVVSPSIRVVGRRKGTKSLPTPQPLTEEQRRRQAWKWIVEASDKRQGSEKVFGKRLAQEVLAVLAGQSEAIKKKETRCVASLAGGWQVADPFFGAPGTHKELLGGRTCRGDEREEVRRDVNETSFTRKLVAGARSCSEVPMQALCGVLSRVLGLWEVFRTARGSTEMRSRPRTLHRRALLPLESS